jgi:outer membrane protein assembly factor BamA
VVSSIELRSDVELPDAEELLRSVSVEVDQPLDREDVARSLRNLHATGVAGQIEAYLLGSEQRPTLVFVIRGRTLVEKVTFEGEYGLGASQVRNAVVVGEGEPLLADRVFRSVYQLRELYESEG